VATFQVANFFFLIRYIIHWNLFKTLKKIFIMKLISGKQLRLNLSVLSIALLFVGSALSQHSAPWNAPESAKTQKNPFPSDKSSIIRGMNSYNIECARCHGEKGRGDGPAAARFDREIPDLTVENVQNQPDGELYWKISEGRRPMPYKKKALTDDQRWDVINYIRSLKSR
jgi:mono/diheme cytochrome c family protein